MTTLITAIVASRKKGIALPDSLTNVVCRLDLADVEKKSHPFRWIDTRIAAMFEDIIDEVLLDEELIHSIEEKVTQVLLPKLKDRLLHSNTLGQQEDYLDHLMDSLHSLTYRQTEAQPSRSLKVHLPPIFHRYATDLSIPMVNKQRAGNKIVGLTERFCVSGLAHLLEQDTVTFPSHFDVPTQTQRQYHHSPKLDSRVWRQPQREEQRSFIVCGNCGHLKEVPLTFHHCCSEEERLGSVGVGSLPESLQSKISKQLVRVVIGFVTTLITAARLAAAGLTGFAVRFLKRIGQHYIELFNALASQYNNHLPPKCDTQQSSQK